MKPKIIFITTEGITSSVYKSQVIGLVKSFIKKKYESIAIVRQSLKVNWRIFLQNIFDNNKKIFIDLLKTKNTNKRIADYVTKTFKGSKLVLICRNPEALEIGLIVKNYNTDITLIYDLRGAVEEEQEFFNNFEKAAYFRKINKKAFARSDVFFNFISTELREYYENIYGIPLNNKSIICPSAADINELQTIKKKETNLKKKKPKVIYIGGVQAYQNIDKIIENFSRACELTIILTKELDFQAKNKNFKLYINLSRQKIHNIAAEMDYGIIWRDDTTFNKVATPTKISEYWAFGLKVLAINNAGSFTSNIKANAKLGKVLEEDNIQEQINSLQANNDDSDFLIKYVRKNFSIDKNVDKYINFLKDKS